MKKIMRIMTVCVAFFLISGCTSDTGELPKETEESRAVAYETPRVIIPENELVYKNEEAGYQITFPENWRGYYVITEYSPEEVCVGFYGKSKTGRIAYKHWDRDGLDLGWIVTHEPTPDEGSLTIAKLGKAHGVSYFLTSPRGGPCLPDLEAILRPDSTTRQLARYEVDATEEELVAQDTEKALPMRDDLYEGNFIFEAIKK